MRDPELDQSVTPEAFATMMRYMNTRFAVMIGNKGRSGHPVLAFPETRAIQRIIMPLSGEKDAIARVKDRRFKDKRGYTHDWFWWWSRSKHRKTVHGVIFKPGEPQFIGRYYNTGYPLFVVEPQSGEGHKPYLDHILEVICDKQEQLYEAVISSMAQIVQHPQSRVDNVCLCVRGKKGSGKGTLAQIFGQLFGRHYLYSNTLRRVTQKFNAQLRDKLFVFLDEGFWQGGNRDADKLLRNLHYGAEVDRGA